MVNLYQKWLSTSKFSIMCFVIVLWYGSSFTTFRTWYHASVANVSIPVIFQFSADHRFQVQKRIPLIIIIVILKAKNLKIDKSIYQELYNIQQDSLWFACSFEWDAYIYGKNQSKGIQRSSLFRNYKISQIKKYKWSIKYSF